MWAISTLHLHLRMLVMWDSFLAEKVCNPNICKSDWLYSDFRLKNQIRCLVAKRIEKRKISAGNTQSTSQNDKDVTYANGDEYISMRGTNIRCIGILDGEKRMEENGKHLKR